MRFREIKRGSKGTALYHIDAGNNPANTSVEGYLGYKDAIGIVVIIVIGIWRILYQSKKEGKKGDIYSRYELKNKPDSIYVK